MEKYKMYEPTFEPCRICEINNSILLPLCIIDGKAKLFPVCSDCRDCLPYETIPIQPKMDVGYICLSGNSSIESEIVASQDQK